jgi:hypothetical protein
MPRLRRFENAEGMRSKIEFCGRMRDEFSVKSLMQCALAPRIRNATRVIPNLDENLPAL